ncbi:NADPH:quinone reductase [Streptomyces viridiviolaceus]|uniref:Zinc-binding dehydrogenase n=1 Tax=Streptomyces viridiviolaceus TaxID=68282 RepID=A0ABW2E9W6_9ACTN|nr:zinc-binding dehydrogenase [Streptomyces viridiviolaceus]GHB67441.1 NADPH:quinone reductase [Streptomyces viridiviolaceus]
MSETTPTTTADIMKAVVLTAPNGVDALAWSTVPRPEPTPGEALVRVCASSVMSADLPTLDGVSAPGPGLPGPRFPMIMGNEFVGEVVECPGGELPVGQKVAAGFGGYGFTRDGGQAEYVLARCRDLWPFTSHLPWTTLTALPKAFGSAEMIKQAIAWQQGDVLLVRGGSTAIGLATAALAKLDGVTTVGTTRNPHKADAMREASFDHVLLDGDDLAARVVELFPDGVGGAVEMLGYPHVVETLKCVKPLGTVCMVGILAEQAHSRVAAEPQNRLAPVAPSPQWFIPAGVRLTTAMQNGVTVMKVPDPQLNHMQDWADRIAEGRITVPVQAVLPMSRAADAYRLLESSDRIGRIVLAADASS